MYDRGALALHALRLRVGDEAFFKIFRDYYDQYKYATASTRDFIAIAEKVSGTSLDEFFDLWLYDKTAIPDIPEMKLFHKIGATVKAPTLRVRSGPGPDYAQQATVSQGVTLRVLGQTKACDWLRVRTAETAIGWVSGGKEFVELSQPCDAIPVAATPLRHPADTQADGQARFRPHTGLPRSGKADDAERGERRRRRQPGDADDADRGDAAQA